MREAKSQQLRRRVARIVISPVLRAKDAEVVRAMCHLATEMLEECFPWVASTLEVAEPDALAYLDLPAPPPQPKGEYPFVVACDHKGILPFWLLLSDECEQ